MTLLSTMLPKSQTPTSGFLLVDKPAGITSHDVIDALRKVTGIRKIGHAGTLDPFATGLLVVGIGREATRLLSTMMAKDKEYEAQAMLGATSDTQDLKGEIVETPDVIMPSPEQVHEALALFRGDIMQTPPMYSAKKIKGKKLYELARKGEEVERVPVAITIHELELLNFSPPLMTIRVKCGKGTYIRTLAHDIGQKLGTGAYLKTLRRTAIGTFKVNKATPLKEITPENWQEKLFKANKEG